MKQKQAKMIPSFSSPISPSLQNTTGLSLQQMRWFFLLLLSFWTLAAMVLPIIAYCITANLASLTLFATVSPPAYIIYRIACFLFPRSSE